MSDQAAFRFELPGETGHLATPVQWLKQWSDLYDKRAPNEDEPVYRYLVGKGRNMTAQDLRVLGMWKGGALKKGQDFSKGVDANAVVPNRKWSPRLIRVAYHGWQRVADELGGRMGQAFDPNPHEFLHMWSDDTYLQEGKGAGVTKRFGLSRASTLLHFITSGKYPILDSRVRKAINKIADVKAREGVDWYLLHFLPIFRKLAAACEAPESDSRIVDKALFACGRGY